MAMNHNVRLSLIFTFIAGTSRGVWSFSVLSGYLYVLTNSNFMVGLAEGIQGSTQVLVAIPSGIFLTDGIGRDSTLKIGGVVAMVTIAFTLISLLMTLHWQNELRFIMICASLSMWGAFQGIWKGALESIYADSLHEDQKSKYLVYKFVITLLSSTAGPLTGIGLFLWRGDTWTMPELTAVFCFGISIMVFGAIVLLFFDDKKTLGAESEAAFGGVVPSSTRPSSSANDGKGIVDEGEEPLLDSKGREHDMKGSSYHNDVVEENLLDVASNDGFYNKASRTAPSSCSAVVGKIEDGSPTPPLERSSKRRALLTKESVPYIIVTSDIMMGLASGMTIKFFPLFFKNEAGLSPVGTLLINVVTFPIMSACSKLAQYISDPVTGCMSRVQICIITSYIGISCLVLMSVLRSVWQTWYIICPIYVARTAIMNCNYPLRKSILMNFVPKKSRGRWNSIDSVTRFGWSGSALIGGYLADRYGYGFSFLVTATIQFMAASTWWLLLALVPRRSHPAAQQASTSIQ